MQGDIPLAVYSFEYFAIKEGRLKGLMRPLMGKVGSEKGRIFNFAGHRFRVTRESWASAKGLTDELISEAGFREGEGLTVRQKMYRWLESIGGDKHLWYCSLEPLERESNEPKTS